MLLFINNYNVRFFNNNSNNNNKIIIIIMIIIIIVTSFYRFVLKLRITYKIAARDNFFSLLIPIVKGVP